MATPDIAARIAKKWLSLIRQVSASADTKSVSEKHHEVGVGIFMKEREESDEEREKERSANDTRARCEKGEGTSHIREEGVPKLPKAAVGGGFSGGPLH
jgi:hypothetical protein